jgi:Ca2+:H+ antiporter
VVLLLLYEAHLIYVLITHRSILTSGAESGTAEWSLLTGILVMLSGTLVTAVESELVTARLAETASQVGFSPVFMGVVVLALAGTIADLFASVAFPRADRRHLVPVVASAASGGLHHQPADRHKNRYRAGGSAPMAVTPP